MLLADGASPSQEDSLQVATDSPSTPQGESAGHLLFNTELFVLCDVLSSHFHFIRTCAITVSLVNRIKKALMTIVTSVAYQEQSPLDAKANGLKS